MAIGSNSAVLNYGTQFEIIAIAGADVATGGYSDSGDLTAWTNTDNVPMAAFIADFTFSAAPTANTTVDLFGQPQLITSTSPKKDQNAPDGNFESTYVGSFALDAGGTTTVASFVADITDICPVDQTVVEFTLKNNSGQDLKVTSSTVDIVPMAIVPKA